jgi:hypothetical protein
MNIIKKKKILEINWLANELNAYNAVFLQKLRVTLAARKVSAFCRTRSSLFCWQENLTGQYLEPNESNESSLSLRSIFMLFFLIDPTCTYLKFSFCTNLSHYFFIFSVQSTSLFTRVSKYSQNLNAHCIFKDLLLNTIINYLYRLYRVLTMVCNTRSPETQC